VKVATDTELVEAAAGGDIESFGKLCERHCAAMTALAYSVLADHHLAEDAAQETFARALTNLQRLKDGRKFARWLAAICRNVAKDMLAVKTRNLDSEAGLRTADKTHEDDYGDLMRRALMRLPSGAREIIVLRYYDGLSYDEIASVSGVSRAAINGRLTRAKRKLARYLSRFGFAEDKS
jgi:RNA polymerase sigma-70 factor (ECF subfamily)